MVYHDTKRSSCELLMSSEPMSRAKLESIQQNVEELVDMMDGSEGQWQTDLINDMLFLLDEVHRLRGVVYDD